jgi:signal transduction histidine kinase
MAATSTTLSAGQQALLDRLLAHATLGKCPREELEWLVRHGKLVQYEAGAVIARKGEVVDGLYILLSGRASHHMNQGGTWRKVIEWRAGEVTGKLPYSRMGAAPGNSFVDEPSEVLLVASEHVERLPRECPTVTAKLVHVMLDRARTFKSSDFQVEKMASLGKLAAGLAHELNNPASAAVRSAKSLAASLVDSDEAARALGAALLTEEQRTAVERVREVCLDGAITGVLSPLDRADREDAIAGWLEAHGVDRAAAPALADTPLTLDALDELARVLSGDVLGAAIRWVAAGCTTRALARDVERASSRIYDLVAAVKGFTYMDRSTAPQPVDVGRGLSDTVAVLASKARARSAAISVDVEPALPQVRAVGGELNQVWLNLIDNALDAVPDGGHVTVTARHRPPWVVVSVIDDGHGIPKEVQSRIFEPFFTTKKVGDGTGLGLDTVRQLLARNDGEIEVESSPGHTEFRVSLPVADERRS